MPWKNIATRPPYIAVEDFEDFLVTDKLFVDFFNTFLGLPSFPDPIHFNVETESFEVRSCTRYKIANQIKAAVKMRTNSLLQNGPKHLNSLQEVDIQTKFNVKFLQKEQGIEWIKEERLPLFLVSDLYSEYRLAKLLSQVTTSSQGMKLSIDPGYCPWDKTKKDSGPPTNFDESEELFRSLHASLGLTTFAQTQDWLARVKQVQQESTLILPSSRMDTSPTITLSDSPRSSSRPTSDGIKNHCISEDSSVYLIEGRHYSTEDKTSIPYSARLLQQFPSRPKPLHVSNLSNVKVSTTEDISIHAISNESQGVVDKVTYIQPSDDDTDSEAGSKSFLSLEEDVVENIELKLRNVSDFSSIFVALCLKEALSDFTSNITDTDIDNLSVFKELIPKLGDFSQSIPISKLNIKVITEALRKQENRTIKKEEKFSRSFQRYGQMLRTDVDDIGNSNHLPNLWTPPTNMSTTKETDEECQIKHSLSEYSDSDSFDSIFSKVPDDGDLVLATKAQKYLVFDFKQFGKFKEFIKGTMGDNIRQLWMDVDKIRLSLKNYEIPLFLSKMRKKYLRATSTNHVSKELLKTWNLGDGSVWTAEKLKTAQERIVESLLLYWIPRFMIHISMKPRLDVVTIPAQQRSLTSGMRPFFFQTDSQASTIKPLRPKSCIPVLKERQKCDAKGKQEKYHEMGLNQMFNDHPKCQQSKQSMHYAFQTKELKSFPLNLQFSLPEHHNIFKQRPASAEQNMIKAFGKNKRSAGSNHLLFPNLQNNDMKQRCLSFHKSSISSEVSSLSNCSSSSILGSELMESMLQALYHDTQAGSFFARFCEQSGNKQWNHAIHFWFDMQEFHSLFYCFSFDSYAVQRKAQMLYSLYIVPGAPREIHLSEPLRNKILRSLKPVFEELFDVAEEFVLKLLIVPWNEMIFADQRKYRKIELIERERKVRIPKKYSRILQSIEKPKKQNKVQASPMTFHDNDKQTGNLWDEVPEEFQSFAFSDLLQNRIELEHFRKFLEDNYAKSDFLCWIDMEKFRGLPHEAPEKRDEKAKEIKLKYLNKKYFFGPVSPASKQQQNKVIEIAGGWGVMLKERPPNELILESQKYVYNRLANQWLPRYLTTPQFAERQRITFQMSDVVEDMILQRTIRKGDPWKIVDNKWSSFSRELIELRRALTNPITASQFQHYVSTQGGFLENDVLFWLEVQKFKSLCHTHNEQTAIDAKMSAIVQCFLESQIPPAIQIDIPLEMAERIIHKKKDLGPYIFREAQLTILRVLFPCWSGFCKFRKNLTDKKVTTTLERQRARRMDEIKQQLFRHQNQLIEKEQAEVGREMYEKEGNYDGFADILSTDDSEANGSIAIAEPSTPSNQIHWSYGKYAEALDRERNSLIMENELRGRIPMEQFSKADENVSSVEESDLSDDVSNRFLS